MNSLKIRQQIVNLESPASAASWSTAFTTASYKLKYKSKKNGLLVKYFVIKLKPLLLFFNILKISPLKNYFLTNRQAKYLAK